MCMFNTCRSLFDLFRLVIALSVLQFTDSDYPYGILKLFLHLLMLTPIASIQWNSIYFLFNNYFCGLHSHMSQCTNINNWFLPTNVIIVFGRLSFQVELSSELYFFLSHNILYLISHPTPIDILPRKKSLTQALIPFVFRNLYIFIKLTCNVWAISSLFVFFRKKPTFSLFYHR